MVQQIDLEIRFSHQASHPGSKATRLPYARAFVAGYSPAQAQVPGWPSFLVWWKLVAKCVEYQVTGKYPL